VRGPNLWTNCNKLSRDLRFAKIKYVVATGPIKRPVPSLLQALARNHLDIGIRNQILSWEHSGVTGEAVPLRTPKPLEVDKDVGQTDVTELYPKIILSVTAADDKGRVGTVAINED
jgi:hypothetical protein